MANCTLNNIKYSNHWNDNMAPVYKLKFFNLMGVGEPIRYLFAYGGIQYENVVVQEDVDWVKMKKIVPFGKLPILELDNKILNQSTAISRYLGKLVGLVPADDFQAAELDAIVGTVYDLAERVHEWYQEVRQEKKAELQKELQDVVFPRYLTDFEKILQAKGGYFGGKKLSWADLYFVGIIESIQGMWTKNILEKQYPLLYKVFLDVQNVPTIKTYISKRPSYKY